MIDPKKGFAQPKSQPLGKGYPHKQTAEQTRPPCSGYQINLGIGPAATVQQLIKERTNKTVMLTRSKLWHYPAKKGVHVSLTCQHGFNQFTVFNQSQCGFIARTFNS